MVELLVLELVVELLVELELLEVVSETAPGGSVPMLRSAGSTGSTAGSTL